MKIMIRGALAALSIASISPAFANEGDGVTNTLFIERPGVVAQAPVQNSPATAAQSDASSTHTPWLFPPIGKYLNQHAG